MHSEGAGFELDALRLSNSSHETGYETPPETKLETKLFTKLFRFCVWPNSLFWGFRIRNSDTKLRCGFLLGLSYLSFVSGPRFLRYKTSLVSGFEFRIRVSFTKLKKKQFRFPFPEQRIAPDTKLGWVTKLKSHQKPTSSFVSEFRIRVSCDELISPQPTSRGEHCCAFSLLQLQRFTIACGYDALRGRVLRAFGCIFPAFRGRNPCSIAFFK